MYKEDIIELEMEKKVLSLTDGTQESEEEILELLFETVAEMEDEGEIKAIPDLSDGDDEKKEWLHTAWPLVVAKFQTKVQTIKKG